MDRKYWVIAGLMLVAAGCSQSADTGSQHSGGNSAVAGSPDQTVHDFLEAVRLGNDQKAAEMLTPLAREEAAKNDLVVAPRGSASATFKVGKVEYKAEKDGAYVQSMWTDADDTGKPRTDEFIWAVRKEPMGWRIAGTVTKVFPDQPPLVLNFEDAADMKRKLQLLEEGVRSDQQVNQQEVQVQTQETQKQAARPETDRLPPR
jgi:hypothetical protein